MELARKINDAYGATTQNRNHFKECIDSIEWDEVFKADGEAYFCKGNLTLTVENLNPFKEAWKPTIMLTGNGPFLVELGINAFR